MDHNQSYPVIAFLHTVPDQSQRLIDVFEKTVVHSLNLRILPAHGLQILGTAILYLLVQNCISPIASKHLLPHSYPKFSRKSKVLWDMGMVQMIKAPINCASSLAIITQNKHEPDLQERVWGYSASGASVQAIATGFYVFEILVSMEFFDVLGWPILLHGIASCSCSLLAFRPVLSHYGCRFLLLELPVFFEVFGNSLHKLRKTDSAVFRYNQIVMAFFYVFAKIIWAPYQLYYAFLDCWTVVQVRGSNEEVLPLWVAASMLGSVVLIIGLGLYWMRKALWRE